LLEKEDNIRLRGVKKGKIRDNGDKGVKKGNGGGTGESFRGGIKGTSKLGVQSWEPN